MAKTVKKFLSKLQVEDLDGNQWKLLAPLIYQGTTAPSGQAIKTRYIAPKGFVTDLASIPRFIFWRAKSGNYNESAVLHDAAYSGDLIIEPPYAINRGEADNLFRDTMKVLGVGWWTRTVLHRAVRLGGWKSWRAYRHAEQAKNE